MVTLDIKITAIGVAMEKVCRLPEIDHLHDALTKLDAGAWGDKVLAFMDRIDREALDDRVSLEAFHETLRGFIAGIEGGCRRIKVAADQRRAMREDLEFMARWKQARGTEATEERVKAADAGGDTEGTETKSHGSGPAQKQSTKKRRLADSEQADLGFSGGSMWI